LQEEKEEEEMPPVPVMDPFAEDTKKVSRNMATSEQLWRARITQVSCRAARRELLTAQDWREVRDLDPGRMVKVQQGIDITGRSEDEVTTALFDSDWDVPKV
jgi:hypothetical protein